MATKSLVLDEPTDQDVLTVLCGQATTAVQLCAGAVTQEGIETAKSMYSEAQNGARQLGYCIAVRRCSPTDWEFVAMEIVQA
jgi:hypothetical protein